MWSDSLVFVYRHIHFGMQALRLRGWLRLDTSTSKRKTRVAVWSCHLVLPTWHYGWCPSLYSTVLNIEIDGTRSPNAAQWLAEPWILWFVSAVNPMSVQNLVTLAAIQGSTNSGLSVPQSGTYLPTYSFTDCFKTFWNLLKKFGIGRNYMIWH